MSKVKKRKMKRQLAGARNDINRAIFKLAMLHVEFEPSHPEYAEFLEGTIKGLMMHKTLVEDFWRHAWGAVPGDWDSYVGAGKKSLDD